MSAERPPSPAALPPAGLPGLEPSWSRLVSAADSAGVTRTWHVLDVPADGDEQGTLLCVHGNPTWSYLWRSVVPVATAAGWRVVAPDHLGMGWSERTGEVHRLADRVDELERVVHAVGVTGPVVLLAHDWGGAISLGWALRHRSQVVGIALTNTAVSQPAGARVPPLIGLFRSQRVLGAGTVRTPAFVRGTLRLAHPRLSREVAQAFASPYRTAARRVAVGDFVADIPLEPGHPSRSTLDAIGDGLTGLAEVPTVLLWGPRDPVFSDRYLRDLQRRLPQAQTHRFEGAGHLVVEDAPVAAAVGQFLATLAPVRTPASPTAAPELVEAPPSGPPVQAAERRWLGRALDDRAGDPRPAVVELGSDGPTRTVHWSQLATVVNELAAGFGSIGVGAGSRVALLVPPGADLTACVYACWRAGAVVVVADAGLGLPGLRRALRGADVSAVVGTTKTLAAARAMGLPGTYVVAGTAVLGSRRAVGAQHLLVDLALAGRGCPLPPVPGAGDEAAVLFTSGATGPAKGVVYRHAQLEAQRDLLAEAFALTDDDRLVAAFAPFALYGPALGVTTAVPDMDVTRPGTLTAGALADAVEAVDATVVFGAPAALRNVVDTADGLDERQRASLTTIRLLLSAGAPVPTRTLAAASRLLGGCDAHTPYGMTEALPVADVSLAELAGLTDGDGVCVGRPLPGVQVAVSPLAPDGSAEAPLSHAASVTGEICVRARHVKDRYDQLWATELQGSRNPGWHRTGDVGHLDPDGRLWVEGRLAHVVVTAHGVVTPVGVERRVEELADVRSAAVVGVGPRGTQQVVVVVESPEHQPGLADPAFADRVRGRAGVPVAAVIVMPHLPVDVRHNSKIDRGRVARDMERLLHGAGA